MNSLLPLDFAEAERASNLTVPDPDLLYLDIDGWEGPLDLLLDLARRQKVDLRKISILELVDQYLAYIEGAATLKLEIATEYLVMAAWLAYLKSALLLPKEEQEEPGPEELALQLQIRLQRLGAMREAGARLMARRRLGRDIFTRGAAEGLRLHQRSVWQCSWYELISAYGRVKVRTAPVIHAVRERAVITLESALSRLSLMLGHTVKWKALRDFLPSANDPEWQDAQLRRSALASSFVAALELARTGEADIAQDSAFTPLYLRKRQP